MNSRSIGIGASDLAEALSGAAQLQITVRREQIARYGLNVSDVQNLIETAVGGKVATLEYAGRRGLLDLEVLAAHCVWVGESDISLLAARDVKVAHNPVANMILASGVCPVPRLRREGVTVGIGTDGAASNDSNNMLEAMKMAALIQKLHHLDATRMRAVDALRMATIEGARALALDHEIGSIEVGKKADLVLHTLDRPEMRPTSDMIRNLVFSSRAKSIRCVVIDGRVVLDEGAFPHLDEPAIKKWQALARDTAWKDYAAKSPNCARFLQLAEKTL